MLNISNDTIFIIVGVSFCLLVLIKYLYKKFSVKYSHKWRRKSANKVLEKIKNMEDRQVFAYLRKIDAFVMEELVLSAFDKREDIKIIRNKRYTGDNGVDGRIYHHTQSNGKSVKRKYLIQVKRYSSYINKKHILEFEKQISEEKAYSGFFVHTGKTSKDIMQLSREINMDIISGQKLIQLVKYSNVRL